MTRSPAALATMVAVPAMLITGVAVGVLVSRHSSDHIAPAVPTVAAAAVPAGDSPECRSLLAAAPNTLGDYHRVRPAAPAPAATMVWQRPDADPPLVLRCGVPRPAAFTVTANLQVIDGVQWLEAAGPDVPGTDRDTATWYIVDRPVYLEVTVPAGSGPTPIQDLADTVVKTLPSRPLDPAPLPR